MQIWEKMGKTKMKKMQETIENSNASMVYPVLTNVNNKNGEYDKAKKVFNKIPEELIEQEFTDTLRELATKIIYLSSNEDFEKYINKVCQGGLGLPNSPKDFVRKLLSLDK